MCNLINTHTHAPTIVRLSFPSHTHHIDKVGMCDSLIHGSIGVTITCVISYRQTVAEAVHYY